MNKYLSSRFALKGEIQSTASNYKPMALVILLLEVLQSETCHCFFPLFSFYSSNIELICPEPYITGGSNSFYIMDIQKKLW